MDSAHNYPRRCPVARVIRALPQIETRCNIQQLACCDYLSSVFGCSASTICAQVKRTELSEYGLAGHVQSVETILVDMSTKSYKLLPGGREALDDFGNPSAGSPDDPLLCEFLKFDPMGRLVEDVDAERPFSEQESYRYVYTYNQQEIGRAHV